MLCACSRMVIRGCRKQTIMKIRHSRIECRKGETMNENNANLCEMEQEIFQIKDKYKPYFELEKENRKLKIERLEMLHTAEKFLFALIAALLVDLLNKMIF